MFLLPSCGENRSLWLESTMMVVRHWNVSAFKAFKDKKGADHFASFMTGHISILLSLQNPVFLNMEGTIRNVPTSVRDELSAFSKITWLLPTISPMSICQRKQSRDQSKRHHLLPLVTSQAYCFIHPSIFYLLSLSGSRRTGAYPSERQGTPWKCRKKDPELQQIPVCDFLFVTFQFLKHQ